MESNKKRKEPPAPIVTKEESWDEKLQRYEKKRKLEKEKQEQEKKRLQKDKALPNQKELDEELSIMFGNQPPPSKKQPLNRKLGTIDLGNEPFIDTIDKCKVAVAELSKQKMIAVDCEWAGSRDVPRTQELCLLQIANPFKKAYLFDVLAVGKDLFDKGGLKELLENKNIMKIFHDCRWDADILWNQMNVRVENVFDTQIGYACYRRQQESMTPLPVGLKNLLKRFALGGTHTSKEEARQGMEDREDYWKIRPMTEVMLNYAREDVLLLPLVYRQINAIFSTSSRTVAMEHSKLYLNMRRDKTIEELQAILEEEQKEKKNHPEGKYIPQYGIPDWDLAAKVSLDRINRRFPTKK
uniref:3'-5' exonuclease domain-containing protein n=1 Tax=Arcella intermedia TaxID=1963864 RepID=A0A6B2L826_9EUKA